MVSASSDRSTDSRFFVRTFDNGLTLLAERMPGVKSAAMNLLVPAGSAGDPVDRCGSATVLAELVLRGAGERNARELTEHLDTLGLSRSSYVTTHHTRFAAAGLAANVMAALPVYADIVRRPRLPESGVGPAKDLALQALEGLEDDPRSKVMIQLRQWHWPSPYSRSAMGEADHIERLTRDLLRADFEKRFVPDGTILTVAGDVDPNELAKQVETLFGDWQGSAPEPFEQMPPPGPLHHEEQESQQTHIGIAWPSVPENHEDYYRVRLLVEVLSGGSSGRLFDQIREKRGLCYAVYAGYNSLRHLGSIFGYAGTSNERAQETLDAFLHELSRLKDGVEEDELQRARIGLKAGTVMSEESSSSRAASLARDWFARGRLRTLDEILAAVDAVTAKDLSDYLASHEAGPFTVCTIGPRPLEVGGR